MKTFKVKAVLTFKDGILPGQIKVKAASMEDAKVAAVVKLNEIWGSSIQKVEIK